MKKIYPLVIFSIFMLFSFIYITFDASNQIIVSRIRIPRFLLTLSTGMILSGVGYTYQILLNNPLADPYILGVSSGAALGSVLMTLTGYFFLVPIGGFVGALLAMFFVWMFVYLSKSADSIRFVLSGVVVSMFFSACLSLLMYLNQQEIGNIISILMGNLGHIFSQTEWMYFLISLVVLGITLVVLFLQMPKLAIASLGDEHALSVGLNIKKFRLFIFVLTALITGFCVSFAGMIGFVGLIIPHIVRLLDYKSTRVNFVYSLFFGSFVLLICDFIAQHISVLELPVGIVTAFLGSPVFGFLLLRKSR